MTINYAFQCKGSDPKGKKGSDPCFVAVSISVAYTGVRVVTQKKEYEPGSDPTKNENG
jgi:hypothetical protein